MEQTSKRATFDDILEVLGEFGTFQKLVYYAFSLTYVFTSMQLMGWVFVGARVPFKCNDSYSSNFTSSCLDSNGSECDVGFVYDESLGVDSVVREWDLVCSRSSLHAVAGAASMVGCLMGGWTIGVFSDHVGRRPAFVFSMVLLALAGTGATSAPGSLYGFVAARVIVGFALAGAEGSAFVMGMELVGPRKRTHAGIICWFFETAGLLTALLLAYLFQSDWRVLQLTYSAPCVIFVVYHWLTPESVRWLLSKGHRDEAIRVIERSAKVNGVDLPAGMVEQLEIVDRDQQAASTLDLFRHKHLRIKTVILAACWTVCASLYYVLLLDQSELSDDPYVGFLINCAVQVPGYVFVLMTLERSSFGRRKSQCGFLIVTGVTLFGHPFFPDSRLTRVSLSLIGRFCANCAYTVIHLFASEQFPTVVRGSGMGFSFVASRFGSIMAPFILLTGPMAHCIFGAAAILAGSAAILLPETLGKALPQTLAEGERDLPVVWPPWRRERD